jgi:hypothetical protein
MNQFVTKVFLHLLTTKLKINPKITVIIVPLKTNQRGDLENKDSDTLELQINLFLSIYL